MEVLEDLMDLFSWVVVWFAVLYLGLHIVSYVIR